MQLNCSMKKSVLLNLLNLLISAMLLLSSAIGSEMFKMIEVIVNCCLTVQRNHCIALLPKNQLVEFENRCHRFFAHAYSKIYFTSLIN